MRAVITGGTHNPLCPPFEFLERVFLPHLRAMGADVTLTLEKHGVMPDGGGRVVMETRPSKLAPIDILETGRVVARRADGDRREPAAPHRRARARGRAGAAGRTGLRGRRVCRTRVRTMCSWPRSSSRAACASWSTSHGRKGYPAEDVADDALDDLEDYLEAGVPVGEHLADQLLLPMAIAGGGRYRTLPLSQHATTNIETIQAFLDVAIRRDGDIVIVERATPPA